MFNSTFYPTPKDVIRQMIEGLDLRGSTILEPSAGKGDILDYVVNLDHWEKANKGRLYCIEKEPDLTHILREKGYRVIGEDFLNYNGNYIFDTILMNPPFANGDEHLLKAWDILQDGQIICLLNSETVLNPYTERRKLLLKIISDNGSYEHLGKVFTDAERTTDVSVVMVKLTKQGGSKKYDFTFNSNTSKANIKLNEEVFKNEIATNDVVGNMVIQYENLLQQYAELAKAMQGIKFYSNGLAEDHIHFDKIALQCLEESPNRGFNLFNDETKQGIWSMVMRRTNVEKYMTHAVRENFHTFAKSQGYMDFTKENVLSLVTMIFDNRTNILENAVVEVFDLFTKFHKENRCHVEGWKTNDIWRVNQKIILPNWVSYGSYCCASTLKNYGDKFSTNYNKWSEYSDIDKVMCYLTGKKLNEVGTIKDALDRKFSILGNVKTGDKIITETESEFFNLKFFKKGTLHIEFKDKWLWQEFNIRACKGKNWLPN